VIYNTDNLIGPEGKPSNYDHGDILSDISGWQYVNIHGSREDHREILKYTPWVNTTLIPATYKDETSL
jgi:hypothetical protein